MTRLRPWWTIALAFVVTLALETALVERKHAIFGGGFGQSKLIDQAGEWAFFAPALVAAHAAVILACYLAVRALHRRRAASALFELNFLFVTIALGSALLFAKFEALAYFSDAMGFELMRSLGGGSLFAAALYVLDEAALLGLAALGVGAAYFVSLKLVKRFVPPDGGTAEGAPPRFRHLAVPLVAAGALALAGGERPDVRYGLGRFTAFAAVNGLFHGLTDLDRDGYSWFTSQRDAFPLDPARHPFALDVPGNGIDEDGLGGDFRFGGAAEPAPELKLPARPRHLVLIVLESFRGDAIGRTVGGRAVTPNLNALARNGTWVREAYSHVGFTTQSGKSIFGGALEPRHGGPSLFRDLKGYRVGVFSAAPEDFGGISEAVGMRASADIYVDADLLKAERAHESASLGSLALDGRKVLREFDRYFRSAADWNRPNFLYFNFQEAHFPYSHKDMPRFLPGRLAKRSEIRAANREMVERTYWNAAAYTDWLVGEVIRRLKAQGAYDDTLILVTGDHGEALFEEGFLGHGHVLDRAQTHVPLILSDPKLRVVGPVGLADYRGIVLRGLSSDAPTRPGRTSVFQYIGTLDRPVSIGIVEAGGVWTTLNLETEELWFSDSGRRLRYRDLAGNSPEKRRADRLADEWAKQRWLARPGA